MEIFIFIWIIGFLFTLGVCFNIASTIPEWINAPFLPVIFANIIVIFASFLIWPVLLGAYFSNWR